MKGNSCNIVFSYLTTVIAGEVRVRAVRMSGSHSEEPVIDSRRARDFCLLEVKLNVRSCTLRGDHSGKAT